MNNYQPPYTITSKIITQVSDITQALELSDSKGDSTPFIEFMLGIIVKAVQKLAKESKEVGIKVGEKVGIDLTENQKEIISHIIENPKISAKKLSELVGISSRKVEENIKKLKDKQIIERVGANRGGYWRIMDEELWN